MRPLPHYIILRRGINENLPASVRILIACQALEFYSGPPRGQFKISYLTACDSLSGNVILIYPPLPSHTSHQLPLLAPSIASGPLDAEEDERGLPRRKAATTIDTATAEEDVKDYDVPEKNLTGFDQVLLLSTLWKPLRDEVQAQSKSLTSSS